MENFPTSKPKPMMQHRAIILSITLFVLIVVGMFIFVFIKQTEINREPIVNQETPADTDDRYSSITRIDAKHFYIDGVHTVVGEISLPTPCDLLESEAIVAESYPEQITLDFSVINNAEFCAEVVTNQRFKISATASPEASFKALFQNRVVDLNLIEALPGESPEDFELYFKG